MAEDGQVISCHAIEHWDEHFKRGNDTKKVVVVDFTASWCPPCRFIAPIFVEFAKKFPHVIFLKVDVDEMKPLAEKYNVEAMPTFVILKDGEEIERIVGAEKDKLLAAITKHAGESAVTA